MTSGLQCSPPPLVPPFAKEKAPKRPDKSWELVLAVNDHGVMKPVSKNAYITAQLSVKELNNIHQHLWWAGRPGNIHALHDQLVRKREIVITENPNLHLIWVDSTIFIKPLPAFLLDYEFFKEEICPDRPLYSLAIGMLLSYNKLIRHYSDFKVAEEENLVPPGLKWDDWCRVAESMIENINARDANQRYDYGELRLTRVNQIRRFLMLPKPNYHLFNPYPTYSHFFQKNFAWLLLVVIYFSVLLAAMQVVLATDYFTTAFQLTSYRFAVLSILLIVIASVIQLVVFVILFIVNFVATVNFLRRAFGTGVDSFWSKKKPKKNP